MTRSSCCCVFKSSSRAALCAAVWCARLDKPVLFEALQEFTNVAFDNFGTNAEFAADFLDHLGFRATTPQHFEDFGAHEIESEHLAVMDVENDCPVAVVSAPHSFGYLQHGFSPFLLIPRTDANMQWTLPRKQIDIHNRVHLFVNQEMEFAIYSE